MHQTFHRARSAARVRAFTIVELLVVVSIIAVLIGILLPAIGKVREQAKMTVSESNLRNLGMAHAAYAAAWNDRQLTLVTDNISKYGSESEAAYSGYALEHGEEFVGSQAWHAPIYLGWGHGDPDDPDSADYYLYRFFQRPGQVANNALTQPIRFQGVMEYFGSFRLPNCKQFSQYVSGRFYDPVFYALRDEMVMAAIEPCLSSPDEYCTLANVTSELGAIPAWSSYCLSPAGMFNPDVMRHDDPEDSTANGWTNPWKLDAGFRSPSMSQALFPNLKTHMLEHHWLQNRQRACNPTFDPGTYDGCEPYYFNHGWESSPVTLFYDGHVGSVGVRRAMRADSRMRAQTGEPNWGLWSQDTPWKDRGYLIEAGYDQAKTSFHILTTDGIRGRDILQN